MTNAAREALAWAPSEPTQRLFAAGKDTAVSLIQPAHRHRDQRLGPGGDSGEEVSVGVVYQYHLITPFQAS